MCPFRSLAHVLRSHLGALAALLTVLNLALSTFSQQVVELKQKSIRDPSITATSPIVRSETYSQVTRAGLDGMPLRLLGT